MATSGTSQTVGGRYNVSDIGSWGAERWAAIVVLGALGILVMIRMGFRGVDVLGARVNVGS